MIKENIQNCHLICHLSGLKSTKVALGATFVEVGVGAHGFEPRTLCL